MPPIAQFNALADASRCQIIELLLAGPLPVHRLALAFAISRPAISRHLRVLRQAGLVFERKQGRENVYELIRTGLDAPKDWLSSLSEPVKPAPPKPARRPISSGQMTFDL